MIIQSPEYPTIRDSDFVIFLAGPIQGAKDWQQDAINYISKKHPAGMAWDLHVASPRRTGSRISLSTNKYQEQVDWETFYLNRAAKHGVILFWLANEAVHDVNRAFAQTSRFELGEWKAKHEQDGAQLIIGIDDKFSGSRYVKYRFKENPEIKICDSLFQVCDEAIICYLQQPF